MSTENQNLEENPFQMPAFNPQEFMDAEEMGVNTKPEFNGEQITPPNDNPPIPNDDGGSDLPPQDLPPAEDIDEDLTYEKDFTSIKPKEVTETPEEVSNEQLLLIGKTLGVKVETKEDLDALRTKLSSDSPAEPQQQISENYNQLRLSEEELQKVQHSDNVLGQIDKYTDEDILGFQLKQIDPEKYADADELEYQIGNIKDSGLLKMQADSIRKSITDSAKAQKNAIISSAQEKVDSLKHTELKELERNIKSYKDGFHGISVSPNEALRVFQKVSDNSLFDEIESSQANVAEMAMLWEQRNLIYKALDNPSLQPGMKKFFNELSNVQTKPVTGKQVLSNPMEFDPSAFMASDDFKNA